MLQQRKPWPASLTPMHRLPLHWFRSSLRGEFSERRRQAVEAVYEAKPMPQVGGGRGCCRWGCGSAPGTALSFLCVPRCERPGNELHAAC